MSSLLDTERQYRTMSKRIGIFDALDKCFQRSSHTESDAIAKAQRQYQINQSLKNYDTDELKKFLNPVSEIPIERQLDLTQIKPQSNITESKQEWAAMKFGSRPTQ